MISIVLFIVFIAIGAIMFLSGRANDDDRRTIMGIDVAVIGVLVTIFQTYSIEKIDSGHKGLKINLIGNQRGVSSYQYKTGWVFYNSWTEQVLEFPTYQQHIEYEDQGVILKGGFSATIKPTFNYSLREDAIGDMFVNLRKDIKEIEQGWLKNAIIGAVNDVANTWEVDSIFNHRQAFEAAIVTECNVRLSKWFNVSQLRTNIIPPDALQESIIAKTKAIQQAEASEQQAIAAISEGRRKVAVARADSAETIINAQAAALAIKIKQNQLSPLYIEYIKWNAWDGKLPTTVTGNSGTLLNIK
jgi:hypothetical protein